MEREEAERLVKQHASGGFLLKHMLATEAVMKSVAHFLKEDRETWALCGLLHDIDFERTKTIRECTALLHRNS